MSVRENVRNAWRALSAGTGNASGGGEAQALRKTQTLPAVLSPYGGGYGTGFGVGAQALLPKPTPENLRRFAETPVVRRAINLIKDRIACMDWQVRVKRGFAGTGVTYEKRRLAALELCLQEPNDGDSFRTLIEQVLEDMLVGGFGAVEMELTGDEGRPASLWAVDGATIRINAKWTGGNETPRYAQLMAGGVGVSGVGSTEKSVPLMDDELMYLRMNPRTHTPFGLGPLEVAFETVTSFLGAHRFAGKLASNAVAQYALWMNAATPAEHERLIRWWQDEIEGTGRVPILSTETKPEILRFASGTDADLRLSWQQFLIRMVANAFGLPPMLLGLENEVNRATSGEMGDEAFRTAIVPVARLLEQHITRDFCGKRLGWREFEFVFSDLQSRDELTEVQIQTQLVQAGLLTVDEVRAMRGLPALGSKEAKTEDLAEDGL